MHPETVVAILQPGYLPWLGFFEMAMRASVFVLYDTVQYDKDGWRNRNRIKTPAGAKWLTVPVSVHGKPLIKDVQIFSNGKDWRTSHLDLIKQCYRNAPFFNQYFPLLQAELGKPWGRIADLDMAVAKMLGKLVGIPPDRFLRASQLEGLNLPEGKTEKLVAICKRFKADRYYATKASEVYIDPTLFKEAGIALEFQNYQHPIYKQLHGEFVPYLSVLDLLLNEGPDSQRIIRQGEVS